MAQFGMRSMLALAVLATAGGTAPLAAQTVKNPPPKPLDDGARMMQCANGSIVPAGMPCAAPPPPVTSRCPGKIVVPYQAPCPAANAPLPPRTDFAKPPSPISNPGNWVPQSAYPREALRDGIEGTVGFALVVGPNGRPTECRIVSSSGNDPLDWGTCENLMRRARFNPAIDAKGKPVASVYNNRVRWVIPQDDGGTYTGNMGFGGRESPLAAVFRRGDNDRLPMRMFLSMEVVVNADGTQASCAVEADGKENGKPIPLSDARKTALCNAVPPSPLLNENGEPVKSRFIFKFEADSSILTE